MGVMSLKVVNRGNRTKVQPGTSDQTGNHAPKFNWSRPPHGALRVVIACIAYHLDYTDDMMGRLRVFPPANLQFELFNRLLPWFEQFYNKSQLEAAKRKNYDGPLEPLGPDDIHGRLHYLFCKPGSRQHSYRSRAYGISVEHHDSVEQCDKRAIVFARCSTIILRRLKLGHTVSFEEIKRWSQL